MRCWRSSFGDGTGATAVELSNALLLLCVDSTVSFPFAYSITKRRILETSIARAVHHAQPRRHHLPGHASGFHKLQHTGLIILRYNESGQIHCAYIIAIHTVGHHLSRSTAVRKPSASMDERLCCAGRRIASGNI